MSEVDKIGIVQRRQAIVEIDAWVKELRPIQFQKTNSIQRINQLGDLKSKFLREIGWLTIGQFKTA